MDDCVQPDCFDFTIEPVGSKYRIRWGTGYIRGVSDPLVTVCTGDECDWDIVQEASAPARYTIKRNGLGLFAQSYYMVQVNCGSGAPSPRCLWQFLSAS